MRQDIEFDAEGVTLRGWLYTPERADGRSPAIVMTHGFSAVKEMYLDRYADVFANAGMAALVFDNRNFGSSDGQPRQEIDPWAQVRDYRHAITYARTRSEVDPARIGIWGSSYSGGHVLVVGAIDRRVKCVVAQVPLVSGRANGLDVDQHLPVSRGRVGHLLELEHARPTVTFEYDCTHTDSLYPSGRRPRRGPRQAGTVSSATRCCTNQATAAPLDTSNPSA